MDMFPLVNHNIFMVSNKYSMIIIQQFNNYSFNLGQNIWNKIEKSIKSGQDMKSLISAFVCILTAIAKVLFLEERLGTRLYLHPNLRFS